MTSAATRRRIRREVQHTATTERRKRAAGLPVETEPSEPFSDSLYGYELRPLRSAGRARLRWVVDSEPHLALVGLQALQEKVLEPLEVALVADCRAEGIGWEDIGFFLKMTGEGARKKHGAAMRSMGL